MKKLVSFLMAATMLMSLLVLGVSAEQTNMEVTIPKFAAKPTIDGVISVEEWGEKTFRMETEGAATVNGEEIGYNEALGLKNTFYYYEVEGICDTLAYDVWIRWDDEYMYVAAVVEDPDPFSLPTGGEEIWNGDCLQIRVDEKGPSATMLNSNPDFNYKTDAFLGARFSKPWSSDKEVFNTILGMVKGDTPTIWRCGKEYGNGWNLANDGGLVGINLVENEDGTCIITYEGAFTWASVNALLVPKAGDVYGMGIAVACSDSNEINGCLQWGSGIMFADKQPRGTRGGSQAVVLSDETVTPAADYDIATEEVTEAPTEEVTEAPTEEVTEAPKDDNSNKNTEKVEETKKENTKKPASTSVVIDEGLPTGAIIGIVAAVLVVVAVVAIVIVKKKK